MKTLKIQIPGTPEREGTTTIPVQKTGGRGTLSIRELVKAAAIAFIAGAWIVLGQSIAIWYKGGEFGIIWEDVARSGVAGLMGYLSYNIFQKAKVIINAKELLP